MCKGTYYVQHDTQESKNVLHDDVVSIMYV